MKDYIKLVYTKNKKLVRLVLGLDFFCQTNRINTSWGQFHKSFSTSFLATNIEQHVTNLSIFVAHFGILVAHFDIFKAKFLL